jgi:UDP-N-acetylglucosamine--N-acetylmuramyl-(pentapeptide) pyrophosphoryl-undecaprenol N-acetylglucosamine transferase
MTPAHIVAPRLLFYAVDGLGLGHVTRLLAIANSVRDQRPQAQFLFLTTSEADNVIYSEGFSAVKLPSRSSIATTGLWPSVFNKLTQTVVVNTVAAFNPAILVVDTFPAGASHELLPTLHWEMKRAFVYRAQQTERMADPFFQAAVGSYDLCIIPHAIDSEEMIVPEKVAKVWAGEIFIRSKEASLSRLDARRRLGLPETGKVLYVTFGGGGGDEINQAIRVTLEAAEGLGWMIALADAPLSRQSNHYSGSNIYHVRHYPISECFSAFDGAVSAAGYNTVNELMHFGVPTILIPFVRGLDDQFSRVDRLAKAGAVLPATLEPYLLRLLMQRLMSPNVSGELSQIAKDMMPKNGAAMAASSILDLLQPES